MWNFMQTATPAASPSPELARTAPAPSAPRAASTVCCQSSIGKGVSIVGEITGSESLYIDGILEGSIDLPENRVTIGPNGQVTATISARDVVVLGKVVGSVFASNLLDIRAQGSLTGDVSAARLSMEDGAFFQGAVDIHKTESQLGLLFETPKIEAVASKPVRAAQAEAAKLLLEPFAQSA